MYKTEINHTKKRATTVMFMVADLFLVRPAFLYDQSILSLAPDYEETV